MTSNAARSGKERPVKPAGSWKVRAIKLSVYKSLFDINAGFDQVIQGLADLRKDDTFLRRELDRYRALVQETRAAANSYMLGELEQAETAEAGRRFGKRRKRELSEE